METAISDVAEFSEITGHVLVVDDDNTHRTLHRAILAKQFDVVTASSGAEALELSALREPDLILLDIEMPELDGIETCKALRATYSGPVIFATAHESLDEHMRAYDAGGDDIILKPISSEILLRKASRLIQRHREQQALAAEKSSLQQMAMSFLSTMGQNGALLNYMRASVGSRSHHQLAEKLLATAQELGVECSVMIQHAGGPTILTTNGDPTPLEQAILEKCSGMGRIFQFTRQLVVNYDRVSIIARGIPLEQEDAEQAGRVRDNIAILAETTEALCDNVDMRLESMRRAEQLQVALGGAVQAVESLRAGYLSMLTETGLLMQKLVDEVEDSFGVLDTNQEQEAAISTTLHRSAGRVLALLEEQAGFEHQFDRVLDALRGGEDQNDAELF